MGASKKPYLRNTKRDKHAEEGFANNFEGLIEDYKTYSNKAVYQVELLIKRSPCADLKNSKHHHCTNLILNLQKQYPNIIFKVYFMDLYYGEGNDQENNSIKGISDLNNSNPSIQTDYFLKFLNRKSQYYNQIEEYTIEIKRE